MLEACFVSLVYLSAFLYCCKGHEVGTSGGRKVTCLELCAIRVEWEPVSSSLQQCAACTLQRKVLHYHLVFFKLCFLEQNNSGAFTLSGLLFLHLSIFQLSAFFLIVKACSFVIYYGQGFAYPVELRRAYRINWRWEMHVDLHTFIVHTCTG